MGVIYSQVEYNIEFDGQEGHESSLRVDNQLLRLSLDKMKIIVSRYLKYKLSPVLDCVGLHSFFQSSSQSNNELVYLLWKLYSKDSKCYIHDILVCLVLICDGFWGDRLSLLFDIFKCYGTDEVYYDDVLMMCQICSLSLHRLWESDGEVTWKQSELNQLTESLVDELFAKLGKELDSGVGREEFLNWSQERFKASRSIASSESLTKIIRSQYEL